MRRIGRATGLIVLSLIFVSVRHYHHERRGVSPTNRGTSRSLQKFNILDEECRDSFDTHGGLLAYLLGICYLFVGLSVICETYFHESLGLIAEKLRLPEDIAGATFMAAGSSSPELFTSMIALFGVSNDMGVGTVVGSAIFNLLVIVGGSGVVSPTFLNLDWKPIIRDSIFNTFSFLYLVWVFWDGQVSWYEALVGAFGYIAYVCILAINQYVLRTMDGTLKWASRIYMLHVRGRNPKDYELGAVPLDLRDEVTFVEGDLTDEDDDGPIAVERVSVKNAGGTSMEHVEGFREDIAFSPRDDDEASNGHELEDGLRDTQHGVEGESFEPSEYDAPHASREADSMKGKLWGRTKRASHIIMAWLGLPFEFVFKWTIPNMKHPRIPASYLVAFFMCISWIAIISWTMVEFATKVGCILDFNQAIVGLTLLAIGTFVHRTLGQPHGPRTAFLPDCLASLAVAREGKGNMAVCNALGSNIFDILFCLGFPWVFSSILSGGEPIKVAADELVKYVIILFVTMLGVVSGFVLNKWRLDSKVGAGFIAFYCVLLLYFLMEELGDVPYL